MNHYELLAIISGAYADTEVEPLFKQIIEMVSKNAETVHFTQNVGRRKLTYPIKHQHNGVYIFIEFDAAGEAIKKLDRSLKLTQEILRHCIVRKKSIGKPIQFERPQEEQRPRFTGTPGKKTLGEELLGDTEIPSSTEPSPVPEKAPETPEVKEELSTVQIHEEKAPLAAAGETADDSQEQDTKKKGKKVSYEELDKKLNELLSDDII